MKYADWLCDEHLALLGHRVTTLPSPARVDLCAFCDNRGQHFVGARVVDEVRAILADRKRQAQAVQA